MLQVAIGGFGLWGYLGMEFSGKIELVEEDSPTTILASGSASFSVESPGEGQW